jgi:hypothetical protein
VLAGPELQESRLWSPVAKQSASFGEVRRKRRPGVSSSEPSSFSELSHDALLPLLKTTFLLAEPGKQDAAMPAMW